MKTLFPSAFLKSLQWIYAGWWLLWIGLQFYVLTGFGIAPLQAIIDSLLTNFVLLTFTFGVYHLLKYYNPEGENFFYLRLWTILFAVIISYLLNFLLSHLFSSDPNYVSLLQKSHLVRFCYYLLMISFVVAMIWSINYFRAEQEDENRKSAAEKLNREAELTSLRQQLHPHFLFNSLNSINALVGNRPDEARKMIQQLSDFLRGTLKTEETILVTLKEELTHLQLYLDIEKVRFGHRLKTIIETTDQSAKMKLPSLLLQPIVENAIKFGLYSTTGEVTISIRCSTEPRELIVCVENPFDPSTAQNSNGAGFGLSSVKRRLYLLYSRNDLVDTEIRGNIFKTTLRIPPL